MPSERSHRHAAHRGPYRKLLAMAVLHFLAMYGLMYAMVASAADILPNVNQVYMAAVMTAPMVLLELLLMGGMYPRRTLNTVALLVCVAVFAGAFLAIRRQALVDDRQFLKSMIPHHSGAILMCREAPVRDPEVQALCDVITESQSREIVQMKARLAALEGRGGAR